MKHFLLKFNHGVEIGARLAYLGHYSRTRDSQVLVIADEELDHQRWLRGMLLWLGEKPSPTINFIFRVVGTIIGRACKISPIWSLDMVARFMEVFAVVSYRKLSKMYPEFQVQLLRMADAELRHQLYFEEKKNLRHFLTKMVDDPEAGGFIEEILAKLGDE